MTELGRIQGASRGRPQGDRLMGPCRVTFPGKGSPSALSWAAMAFMLRLSAYRRKIRQRHGGRFKNKRTARVTGRVVTSRVMKRCVGLWRRGPVRQKPARGLDVLLRATPCGVF